MNSLHHVFYFIASIQHYFEGVPAEMIGTNGKFDHVVRIVLLFSIISALSMYADGLISNNKRLQLHYFGSETCGECIQVKNEVLHPLVNKYPAQLEFHFHDIETDDGFRLLIDMEKRYGVTKSSAQTLFLPDTFLTGAQDIRTYTQGLIETYMRNPSRWEDIDAIAPEISKDTLSARNAVIAKFKEFSFLGILLAGIADGINPCAIATMIFLVSFLAMQKRKRSEVLVIGLSFTSAVFLTYLLMGVGAFKALTFLSNHVWISKTVKWIAVGFAGIVGVICFRDAIVYKITKKARDIKLQLPKAVKMRIHRVISTQLSGRSLVFGAIVTGFLVTLLEAVCTGQVYLPTIVLMTRQNGLKLTGWLYLIFYNVLFVMPLLVVMILAYYGMTWEKLSKKMQSHLVLLKVLLGTVLVSLAAFLAASL